MCGMCPTFGRDCCPRSDNTCNLSDIVSQFIQPYIAMRILHRIERISLSNHRAHGSIALQISSRPGRRTSQLVRSMQSGGGRGGGASSSSSQPQQQQPQQASAASPGGDQSASLVRRPSLAPMVVQQQQQPVAIDMTQVVGKQVITRTTGRDLGVVTCMWVDPGRGEVVSLDLEDKKGGGGVGGALSVRSGLVTNIGLGRLTQIGDVVLVQDEQVGKGGRMGRMDRYTFRGYGMQVFCRVFCAWWTGATAAWSRLTWCYMVHDIGMVEMISVCA